MKIVVLNGVRQMTLKPDEVETILGALENEASEYPQFPGPGRLLERLKAL